MMIILILIEPQIARKLGSPGGALVQRGGGTLKLDVFGAFFGGEIKAKLIYFLKNKAHFSGIA